MESRIRGMLSLSFPFGVSTSHMGHVVIRTGSCLRAIANALDASSQSLRFFARIPRTCQVIWLVMSFFTARRAIASASSRLGTEEAVGGSGRDEWSVRAFIASVSPWLGNFFKIVSATFNPFLYCLSSYWVYGRYLSMQWVWSVVAARTSSSLKSLFSLSGSCLCLGIAAIARCVNGYGDVKWKEWVKCRWNGMTPHLFFPRLHFSAAPILFVYFPSSSIIFRLPVYGFQRATSALRPAFERYT